MTLCSNKSDGQAPMELLLHSYCTATATGACLHCTVQPSSPLPYPTSTTFCLLLRCLLLRCLLWLCSFSFCCAVSFVCCFCVEGADRHCLVVPNFDECLLVHWLPAKDQSSCSCNSALVTALVTSMQLCARCAWCPLCSHDFVLSPHRGVLVRTHTHPHHTHNHTHTAAAAAVHWRRVAAPFGP